MRVCDPSIVADDWVVKGFHIRVGGVELAVRPGHQRGMVALKPIFASDSQAEIEAAAHFVRERCLSSVEVRERWRAIISRAIAHLQGYHGELADLAAGRQAELHFLERALRQFGR